MQSQILKDLGSGLVLRRGSAADADAVAAFNGRIHADAVLGDPNHRVAAWARDLLSRPHPTLQPDDFTIVEESAAGRIVSSLALIPQTWTYEGIEFDVGRTELVGTLPEFRNRGLVREQLDVVHRWSTERGQFVQAISGIEYYYRQFGYEMAMDLGGRRFGFEANVPVLPPESSEPYHVRPASEGDLALITELYAQSCERSAIACKRTPEVFRYELFGQSPESVCRLAYYIIEAARGDAVGFLRHGDFLGSDGLGVGAYELKPGISWLEVTPSIARYLWERGGDFAVRAGRPRTTFTFQLGSRHPAYDALGDGLPRVQEPYAWYMRVPDLVGFLQHVRPALERRLAGSIAAGHTARLRLTLYRSGIQFVIERGRLIAMEPWTLEARRESGSARFPGLTFLQMVFGRRSLQELHRAFPDCGWDGNEALVLLNALFPRRHVDLFPIA